MTILRSMLFVPGNNMRMIYKAAALPADAIILDLEDAVPLPDKTTARIMIRDSAKALKEGGSYVLVRLNALTTGLTSQDLASIIVSGLDGVMLAKTETRADVIKLSDMLTQAERASKLEPRSLKIVPLIESAKGVVNAYKIASADARVLAVAFGAGDYLRDLGRSVTCLSREQTELLYPRSQVVTASVAAGVQAIDTVFFGLLTDKEGFVKEAKMALQLGFKGKLIIHPDQIEPVDGIFSPSPVEVEYSKRVVSAFEEAQTRGLGAISFEGKMVDIMNYVHAKDLVSQAEIITERETKGQKATYISLARFFASTPR